MKTLKNVFEKVVDYNNLYIAYLNARDSKRFNYEVLDFFANLEDDLVKLQNELMDRTYKLGKYREFYIYQPKKRLIMALPFRDRVVQWAIYQVVNPEFVRGYITDSFACIEDRGSHKAVKRLYYWLRQVGKRPEKYYYLKLDISKYFYRVDHDILMEILKRKFRDDDMIFLFDRIVNSDNTKFGLPPGKGPGEVKRSERLGEKGMPVGNLSSQMFGNLYMDKLDQYCKRTLGIHFYIRYMDDVIILNQDKDQLHNWKRLIEVFLKEKLQLDLNDKTCIRPITLGIEFCGYKLWNTHIKLRKSTALRMKRYLKKKQKDYAAGKVTLENVREVVFTYKDVLKQCNSYKLSRTIFGEYGASEQYEGWFALQKANTETE